MLCRQERGRTLHSVIRSARGDTSVLHTQHSRRRAINGRILIRRGIQHVQLVSVGRGSTQGCVRVCSTLSNRSCMMYICFNCALHNSDNPDALGCFIGCCVRSHERRSKCAGVIMFEAIAGVREFSRSANTDAAFNAAHGKRRYPWEETRSRKFARSRVRDLVLQCLERDPSKRPTAAQLLQGVDRLGNTTLSSAPGDTLEAVSSLLAQT